MGVRHLVLAVNKMDGVEWDQTIFDAIVAEVRASAERHDVPGPGGHPVSALTGGNVTEPAAAAADWYRGPTVLAALDGLQVPVAAEAPFRMPVQIVLRATDFRGYGGLVTGGTLRPGDKVRRGLRPDRRRDAAARAHR